MDSPQQKFFVSDDGKEKVSITKTELQAGIDSGKHGENTLAWTKGMSSWLPLSDPSWEKYGITTLSDLPPELPAQTQAVQSTVSKQQSVTKDTVAKSSGSDDQRIPDNKETSLKEHVGNGDEQNTSEFEMKKVTNSSKPAVRKTFKVYEHPLLKTKAIKFGFSWLAFFFGAFFFFYHKCFKAGLVIIVCSILTWGLIEGVKELSWNSYKENHWYYQSQMERLDEIQNMLSNDALMSSLSPANQAKYNNVYLELLNAAIVDTRNYFENDYEVIFIIIDCFLLLAVWLVFAKKQFSILEKKCLSLGYMEVFSTYASNSRHALALYADEKDQNKSSF